MKEFTKDYYQGVLTGLRICKEMWAQGTISHNNIYENEVYYQELLEEAISGYVNIGTKEDPYYIPKPTEEMREYFTEVFKATFAAYKKQTDEK